MKTKNTYHTNLIIAYRLGAYDEEYFSHIPSSTKSNWKDRNIHNIIGCQKDIICTQNINMVKTFLQKKKALKLAKATYHIFRCYESIAQKSEGLQNSIQTAKNDVPKVIDHIRNTVGFKKALDVFHISPQQYYRWKAPQCCVHSFFDVCFKRKPNQLTQSEVFTIKKYLNFCLYFCSHPCFHVLNHTFMTFGERLMIVRKKKKLSQADMGKKIGISGDAYGRYERGEVRPTIEMTVKTAKSMEVSLDYLTGATDMELDNTMLRRIQDVSKLPQKEKECVYLFLDSFIDRMKLQGAL